MTNIDTLEQRMNAEDGWTSNDYFQLLVSDRITDPTTISLNEEINNHLKKIEHVDPGKTIAWEKNQEIIELTFKEFGYYRLTHSMAYDCELMPFDKAVVYLNEFIESFGMNKRFFTNYTDLDEIIKNYGTITAYQSKGSYGYGCAHISENTFSCALIIVDDKQIGAIVMRDED
jgi:hypothetical protein